MRHLPRESVGNIRITPNIKALNVYPGEGTHRSMSQLKTVGLRLSRDQAIHLARVLLAVTQEWDVIEVTGYRKSHLDGTHQVTVTSMLKD